MMIVELKTPGTQEYVDITEECTFAETARGIMVSFRGNGYELNQHNNDVHLYVDGADVYFRTKCTIHWTHCPTCIVQMETVSPFRSTR